MLEQQLHNNSNTNQISDTEALEMLIDNILHHKRQNSEDSGLGEGNCIPIHELIRVSGSLMHDSRSNSGRNSINRTPDALSSMDCMDDPLLPNHTGEPCLFESMILLCLSAL